MHQKFYLCNFAAKHKHDFTNFFLFILKYPTNYNFPTIGVSNFPIFTINHKFTSRPIEINFVLLEVVTIYNNLILCTYWKFKSFISTILVKNKLKLVK